MWIAYTTGRANLFGIKYWLIVIECEIVKTIKAEGKPYRFVITCKVSEQISDEIFFYRFVFVGR